MSDNNNTKSAPSADNRQFDWGPPASNTADGAKEWLLYVVILVLLCGGVWILLDINGQKPVLIRPSSEASVKNPVNVVSVDTQAQQQIPQPAEAKYFVQLGAFADEVSAREVFDQLKTEGFAPTLAEPDHQYEIFRIFVGPFPSEAEAEQKAQKLNELEFNCFVIESP